MGHTYSLNGFLNAVLRRTGKTLLVEGPTDKALLHKLIAERELGSNIITTIDHAGIIDDPVLAGFGNKIRVLNVQEAANALTNFADKINLKLGTLIDREWDGVALISFAPNPEWEPPYQTNNNFVTLGHSIENYSFDFKFIKEYIKINFAEHINDNLFSELEKNFESILIAASVISIKMKEEFQISRCGGLININHIILRNGRIYLDSSFTQACLEREVSCADTIVEDVNTGIDLAWDKLKGAEFLKWLPHGHIGGEVLWAGTAYLARSAGFPNSLINELFRGGKKFREILAAHWLSKEPRSSREPLDITIEWLHG